MEEHKNLEEQTNNKSDPNNFFKNKWVVTLIASGIAVIVSLIFYNNYQNNKEEEKILSILQDFQKNHQEVDFPTEYDVRKDKEWDSGEVQYELKSNTGSYYVQIKNDEVVKVFTKKPEKQIYPTDSKTSQIKEKKEEDGLINKIDEAFAGIMEMFPANSKEDNEKETENKTKETEQAPLSKTEYTIVVTKLLGEALINVKNVQMLVESPEFNAESIEEATELLEHSIDLYEEFKTIVPPEDWKKLHDNFMTLWNQYILSEEGLVESMKEAWKLTADEREKAMEIAKDKAHIVGDYSLQLGELILQFLGELTGISK